MLKPIKLKDSHESRVWFSSDFHCFHQQPFIWKARGFNSVEEHANAVLKSINDNIKENDVLIYLGDGFLNSNPEQAKNFLRRIICKSIFWLFGNHFGPDGQIYKEAKLLEYGEKFSNLEIYPIRWHNVIFIGRECEFLINGQMVVTSHFPPEIFNHQNKLAISLSGHSHSNNPNTRADCKISKRLDVDWGYKKRPLSFREVMQIMDTKERFSIDHH